MEKKYYHNFDFAHQKNSDNDLPISLKNLVLDSKQFWSDADIHLLESGCGSGSLSSSLIDEVSEITAADISLSAIIKGKQKYPKINFIQQDLCKGQLDQKFNVIVDGHLLHCLVEDIDRKNYLNNLMKMLLPGGTLVLESFIKSKQMQFLPPYRFHSPILYQNAEQHHYGIETIQGEKLIPIRYIPPSMEIEKLIIDTGLTIKKLLIPFGLKGIVDHSAPETLAPDVIQIIAIKA